MTQIFFLISYTEETVQVSSMKYIFIVTCTAKKQVSLYNDAVLMKETSKNYTGSLKHAKSLFSKSPQGMPGNKTYKLVMNGLWFSPLFLPSAHLNSQDELLGSSKVIFVMTQSFCLHKTLYHAKRWCCRQHYRLKKVVGLIPRPGAYLCGVCMFHLCLHGFSLGSPASSNSPNTIIAGELGTLKLHPLLHRLALCFRRQALKYTIISKMHPLRGHRGCWFISQVDEHNWKQICSQLWDRLLPVTPFRHVGGPTWSANNKQTYAAAL